MAQPQQRRQVAPAEWLEMALDQVISKAMGAGASPAQVVLELEAAKLAVVMAYEQQRRQAEEPPAGPAIITP